MEACVRQATHVVRLALHYSVRRRASLETAVGPAGVTAVGESVHRHRNSPRGQPFGRSRKWGRIGLT